MGKEAHDDYKRNLRDREANSARYLVLASGASSPSDEEELSRSLLEGDFPATRSVPSSSIRVGDLVLLEKNQRVPADLILLRTSDSSGTCFIRTDQLDGETDWKLRVAVPTTQKLPFDHELLNLDAEIYGVFLKADRIYLPLV
jgi:phospholipid-translocating ATPase